MSGTTALFDARSTLDALLLDGAPERSRFRRIVGTAVEELVATCSGVTIFDEMVGLLWERGQLIAAMRLENLWNELASRHPFWLCGYRKYEAGLAALGELWPRHSPQVGTSFARTGSDS